MGLHSQFIHSVKTIYKNLNSSGNKKFRCGRVLSYIILPGAHKAPDITFLGRDKYTSLEDITYPRKTECVKGNGCFERTRRQNIKY